MRSICVVLVSQFIGIGCATNLAALNASRIV